jgi:hypothetical protein
MNMHGKVDFCDRETLMHVVELSGGMAHRYWAEDGVEFFGDENARGVAVTYSNPDEWAGDHPVTILFPEVMMDGEPVIVLRSHGDFEDVPEEVDEYDMDAVWQMGFEPIVERAMTGESEMRRNGVWRD